MDSSTLFEDVFEVKEANPDGKFFDKGASPENASIAPCAPPHGLLVFLLAMAHQHTWRIDASVCREPRNFLHYNGICLNVLGAELRTHSREMLP